MGKEIEVVKKIADKEKTVDYSKLEIKNPKNFPFEIKKTSQKLLLEMPMNSLYMVNVKQNDAKTIYRDKEGKYKFIDGPILYFNQVEDSNKIHNIFKHENLNIENYEELVQNYKRENIKYKEEKDFRRRE